MAIMGGGGGGSSKFSNNRGRPYAMMLLLAFGAAVFGVMVLHKFRERRIVNLLIKDKDRDIITLQLLLQKERDYTKEVKRKVEELKAKTYSLRTQKMELNNKLMDMQSTTASLKEEGRGLQAELEKKRNEIQMLKEKEINSSQDSSQVAALTELLKQKETEIDELKQRLENRINVWSVSSDDPSNPPVNLSTTEKTMNANSVTTEVEGGGVRQSTVQNVVQRGQLQKFGNNQVDGEGSKERGVNGEKNVEEGQSRGEVSGEKSESFQENEVLRMRGEEGRNNETEVVERSRDDDALKTKDEKDDLKAVDGKENGISTNQQVKFFETSRGEGRLLGVISKDDRKMEVSDGSQNVESFGARDEDSDRSKTREKRWRLINRNRVLEKTGNSAGLEQLQKNESHQDTKTGWRMDDEVLRTRTHNGEGADSEGKQDGVVSSEEKLNTVDNSRDSGRSKMSDSITQEETTADGHQLRKPQISEDSEHLGTKVATTESHQLGMKGEMVSKDGASEKTKNSQDVESASVHSSRLAIYGLEQKPNFVLRQPKEQETFGVQKQIQREIRKTYSTVLGRRKIPKEMKGQKTWKSAILANNPEN